MVYSSCHHCCKKRGHSRCIHPLPLQDGLYDIPDSLLVESKLLLLLGALRDKVSLGCLQEAFSSQHLLLMHRSACLEPTFVSLCHLHSLWLGSQTACLCSSLTLPSTSRLLYPQRAPPGSFLWKTGVSFALTFRQALEAQG